MKYVAFYIALSISLASCAGGTYDKYRIEPAYVMNKLQMPFFQKSGQVELEASLTRGVEFAGGYSFFDFLSAVGSIRLKRSSFSSDVDNDSNHHVNRYFDLGIGYFMKTAEALRVEAFIRVGDGYTSVLDQYDRRGKIDGDTTFRIGYFSYDYMRYALQVNVGWEWEHWVLGGSVRGGYMDMSNISRSVKTLPNNVEITNSNGASEGSTFLDFGFTTRYQFGQIGFELQILFGNMEEDIGFSALSSSSTHYSSASFSIVGKF